MKILVITVYSFTNVSNSYVSCMFKLCASICAIYFVNICPPSHQVPSSYGGKREIAHGKPANFRNTWYVKNYTAILPCAAIYSVSDGTAWLSDRVTVPSSMALLLKCAWKHWRYSCVFCQWNQGVTNARTLFLPCGSTLQHIQNGANPIACR